MTDSFGRKNTLPHPKKSKRRKKLKASTVLAFKCNQRTRFDVEFTARLQQRSISSFMDISLVDAVRNETFLGNPVLEILDKIWDVDELDRFINLVFELPYSLTYEEAVLWKLIRNNGYFWDKSFKKVSRFGVDQGTASIKQTALNMDRVREYEGILRSVGQNSIPPSFLPKWPSKKGNPHQPPQLKNLVLAEEDYSGTELADEQHSRTA